MGSHYAWRENFTIISLLSVDFSTKQMSFHPRHCSEADYVVLLARTNPHYPQPPICSSTQQQPLAGRVCKISAVWGNSWSCLHHRGWDSRCTRLIEAKSHAHFRGKGGRWGGGGVVWYWAGLIFMQNAPIWVEVSNLLLREVPVAVGRSLLLTDSVRVFNCRSNKAQILSCGAE